MEIKSNEVSGTAEKLVTRVSAFVAIGAVVGALAYVGVQGYRALTDSFVAPIILGPDNDVVIASKLTVSQLESERAKVAAEAEAVADDLLASEEALARLQALKDQVGSAMDWTSGLNAHLEHGGRRELRALARERSVLTGMIDQQRSSTRDARANMESGLVSKGDYMREAQALSQLQLALLENGRTKSQGELQLRQVRLAQSSLSRKAGAPLLPEVIMREDQLVRVELEMLRLQSEKRTKLAERSLGQEKLAKMDEIAAQLRARPIYRAIERRINVAFVPYTQIDGVAVGAHVYECIWGLFACKEVGTVAELVPGEVILPDPWGNQARGQYAVLELREQVSMRSKTLRVRGKVSSPALPSSDARQLVSVR